MTKNDLKSGMVVETVEGKHYLVLTDCDTVSYGKQKFCLIRPGEFINASSYTIDLVYESLRNRYTIVKVYNLNVNSNTYNLTTLGAPFWRRNPIETITIGNTTYSKAEFEGAIKNLKPIE